jgi:3-oxoacyl-[acyl-carrier protein] reductase
VNNWFRVSSSTNRTGSTDLNERSNGVNAVNNNLSGKTAIVTGGARGIGQAIAVRLAADGATVFIGDIDLPAAERAANAIGEHARALHLDVTSEASWQAAIQEAAGDSGGIDILVNNAGIAGRSAPVHEISLEEWDTLIRLDLTSYFLGCKHVIPGMIERGYGRIVNIASIAGKEGNPNAVAYSAAKSGVLGLTKAVAKEVATKGILVNAITPAVIETDILKQVSAEHVAYMTSRVPMGRVGQPEEVAELAAWLCSDAVTFSTGAVFDISGGRATY